MRIFKRLTAASLLLLFCFKGVTQTSPATFTVDQLQQDYTIFIQSLKEAHPGLYRYTSKKKFDSLFATTQKQIDHNMTQEAFYTLLMPLVADIKCGHTKWNPEGKPDDRFPYKKDSLFPLKLYFNDDKTFILYSYDSTIKIPQSSELISINNKPIKEIRNQLFKFITADGNVRSSLYEELNHSFNGYYATFMETLPTYNVRFKSNGNIQNAILPSTNLATITYKEKQSEPVHQLPLRLSYPETGTAVLTIENFYVDESEQKYYPFIDSAFKDIKDRKIKNLVIDLRNNEGGEEDWGGYLYSYLTDKNFLYYKKLTMVTTQPYSFGRYAELPSQLAFINAHTKTVNGEIHFTYQKYLSVQPPQKNNFTGKVYVLINGLSFSVTTELTSVIHNNKRATFIGEETGGAYYGNNSGVFAIVTLPNTKLSLSIPLIGFYSNVSGYSFKDRGISPDHEVKKSVTDVLQNNDTVMNYTLQLIHATQKNNADKKAVSIKR